MSSSEAAEGYQLYAYEPSRAAAIIFAILFGIMLIAHMYRLITSRAYYWVPFVIGVALELIGYAVRPVSAANSDLDNDDNAVSLFAIQSCTIILAPAFMAASLYMTYGRIMTLAGEEHSYIRARLVTKLFVGADVLSFLLQGSGGGLQASSGNGDMGRNLLIGGLVVQIVAFGIFSIVSVLYYFRAKRSGVAPGPWSTCLYSLWIGCILILVRSIFRTIEYAQSDEYGRGYLLDREGFYYGLEAVPIFLTCVLFAWWYPGRYVPRKRTDSPRGVYAMSNMSDKV